MSAFHCSQITCPPKVYLKRTREPFAFAPQYSRGFQSRCRSLRLATTAAMYLSYDYEVFGKVQGVFFRSSTVNEAKKLGVVGWVKNTSAGTVQGQVQGDSDAAAKMKTFLKEKGSPHSRIEKCNITNEKEVAKLQFNDFEER